MTKHEANCIGTFIANGWKITFMEYPKTNVYGQATHIVSGTDRTGGSFIYDFDNLIQASDMFRKLVGQASVTQQDKLYLCQTHANGLHLMDFVVEAESIAEAQQIGLEHFEGLTRLSHFNMNVVHEFDKLKALKKRLNGIGWELYADGGCYSDNGTLIHLETGVENTVYLDKNVNIELLRKLHKKAFVLKEVK